jgi:hypothetical protein
LKDAAVEMQNSVVAAAVASSPGPVVIFGISSTMKGVNVVAACLKSKRVRGLLWSIDKQDSCVGSSKAEKVGLRF